MEMWLKQLTPVLLTVAITAMVIQGQTSVCLGEKNETTVFSGSSLALNCCLNTKEYTRYRIYWYFNERPSFENSTKIYDKIINMSANSSEDEHLKSYILSAVNESNRGWYFCNITAEIPNLAHDKSNGTNVLILNSMLTTIMPTVTKKVQPKGTDKWTWIALGVSSFILLVLLVLCLVHRRGHHRNEDEPIYANTRPISSKQPSPRSGKPADSLKTSSSSQNLRAPSPTGRYEEGKRKSSP